MMNHQYFSVLDQLSDAQSHTIEGLAAGCGLTPEVTAECLSSLQRMGVALTLEGECYRLQEPLECLNADLIRGELGIPPPHIEIFPVIDSTNTYLLESLASEYQHPRVCLAECQQAGRGRRGRAWASPFAANLYLSLSWLFDPAPAHLASLSLASGVAVVRALESLGLGGVVLKWPNDLLWQRRKLGGILLESRFFGKRAAVVIGIGINVSMSEQGTEHIDQPWVDLREINAGVSPSRNRLAAAVLNQLGEVLQVFQQQGFTPFLADWQRLDGFHGQEVVLQLPGGDQRSGVVRGVDAQGALCLETGWGVEHFAVGEVSLRGV